jgi:hypothetical protein
MILNFRFKNHQKIQNKKMYILPTNHVVSMKKFQSKILYILDAGKKNKFNKNFESLD